MYLIMRMFQWHVRLCLPMTCVCGFCFALLLLVGEKERKVVCGPLANPNATCRCRRRCLG